MGVPFFTIDQATAIFVQDSKLLLSETALRKLDLRSKNEAAAVDPMGKSIYIYICVCVFVTYIYIWYPPKTSIQSSVMVFTVFFLTFWTLQLRALSGDQKLHFLQFCSHHTLP